MEPRNWFYFYGAIGLFCIQKIDFESLQSFCTFAQIVFALQYTGYLAP